MCAGGVEDEWAFSLQGSVYFINVVLCEGGFVMHLTNSGPYTHYV